MLKMARVVVSVYAPALGPSTPIKTATAKILCIGSLPIRLWVQSCFAARKMSCDGKMSKFS